MAGRFALDATPAEVARHFGLGGLDDFPPRYNIAPSQPILLVIAGHRHSARQAVLVRWGLIPGWTKDRTRLPLLFNARSETAHQRAAFRGALRYRRALIPASGFYEWRREPRRRQPYWVRPKSGGIVAFAALMETYADAGGSEVDTAAMLTTAAGPDTAYIHERVPVVIGPQHFQRWLDCGNFEPREVADLLRTPPPGFFEAIPVSDRVNTVTNTGPQLQERVGPAPAKPRPGDTGQFEMF